MLNYNGTKLLLCAVIPLQPLRFLTSICSYKSSGDSYYTLHISTAIILMIFTFLEIKHTTYSYYTMLVIFISIILIAAARRRIG